MAEKVSYRRAAVLPRDLIPRSLSLPKVGGKLDRNPVGVKRFGKSFQGDYTDRDLRFLQLDRSWIPAMKVTLPKTVPYLSETQGLGMPPKIRCRYAILNMVDIKIVKFAHRINSKIV